MTGVPVAPVVASDEAGHVLGYPLFVMEFVEGVDTPAPPAVVDDFIRQLDKLHRLPNAGSLELSGRDQVDVWLERASVVDPSPLLLEGVAWLRANRPAHAIDTAPIHGEAGPGNFVHDGSGVALTDWSSPSGRPGRGLGLPHIRQGSWSDESGRLAPPHRESPGGPHPTTSGATGTRPRVQGRLRELTALPVFEAASRRGPTS